MADKGIIFSAPMVRALLAETKTQTRRLIKPCPWPEEFEAPYIAPYPEGAMAVACNPFDESVFRVAPYQGRDRLYVRECAAFVGSVDPQWIIYRASGVENECARHNFDKPWPDESSVRWTPSIHMPRRASRLWLAVTEVRVQRLQDISESDAIAEGLQHRVWDVESGNDAEMIEGWSSCRFHAFKHGVGESAREGFKLLWNSLHTEPCTRWEDSPWVVAVTFKIHKGNLDQ